MIDVGGVFVDKHAREGRRAPGARRADDRGQRRRRASSMTAPCRSPPRIVHVDEHIIVVDKPAGLVTAPTPESDRGDLLDRLQRAATARSTSCTGSTCRRAACSCSRARATRTSGSATRSSAPRRRSRVPRGGDRRASRRRRSIARSADRRAVTHVRRSSRSPGATLVALRGSRPAARTRSACTSRASAIRSPATAQHGGERGANVHPAAAAARAARRGARLHASGDRRARALRGELPHAARMLARVDSARASGSTASNVHALTTCARAASSSNTPVDRRVARRARATPRARPPVDHDRQVPARGAGVGGQADASRRRRPRRSSARSSAASSARAATSSSSSFTKQNRWIMARAYRAGRSDRKSGARVRAPSARRRRAARPAMPAARAPRDVGLELIADHRRAGRAAAPRRRGGLERTGAARACRGARSAARAAGNRRASAASISERHRAGGEAELAAALGIDEVRVRQDQRRARGRPRPRGRTPTARARCRAGTGSRRRRTRRARRSPCRARAATGTPPPSRDVPARVGGAEHAGARAREAVRREVAGQEAAATSRTARRGDRQPDRREALARRWPASATRRW